MANNPSDTTAFEKVFHKFDANGDGKISITELGSILTALGGSPTPEKELKLVMSEIDTDNDGFIDLDEFVAFQIRGCSNNGGDGSAANKELREAFDLYDIDKNGKISVGELHSVMKMLGEKSSVKDCRKMIKSVDVDGDGCVNFEEFKKMMSK